MRDHISYSQLEMAAKCMEQWNLRYNEGKIVPPRAVMVRGTCGHRTLEKNFKQKIESKEDLPVEAVKDFFSDEWEKEKFSIAWKPKDLAGESPTKMAGKIKDGGIKMVSAFHTQQSPAIQPVRVEETIDVAFSGDFPKLTMILDRVDINEEIGEVKFVSKSPAADDIENDLQLTIYDLGYRYKYGHRPTKLKKHWAVDTKEVTTLTQEAPSRHSDTIRRLMWRIQSIMDAMQKGVIIPAPSGSWWCSENWCGYWDICKYRP